MAVSSPVLFAHKKYDGRTKSLPSNNVKLTGVKVHSAAWVGTPDGASGRGRGNMAWRPTLTLTSATFKVASVEVSGHFFFLMISVHG